LPAFALEVFAISNETCNFADDERDVGVKGFAAQAEFHKLARARMLVVLFVSVGRPNLLLLHQLGVGAVIHDILPKDRHCERLIDLLGVHILDLCVKNELVALCTQTDGGLLPKQNERKHIAVLLEAT